MSIETVPSQPKQVEDNGPLSFKPGEKFSSFKLVEERLEKHSQQSFIYFWRRDSKKIWKSHWAKAEGVNSELVYYFLKYSCIFGGAKCQRKGKSRKNVESKRDTNCQAFFTLRLSKDHQTLEVISTNNVHNHDISEESSKSLSNGRKLTSAEKMEVLEMLHLKIDRRLIIEYVRMKMAKELIMKDLFNLQASDKTDWATVSTRSKEVLESWVRNFIVGHDEEVVRLPTFKTLKSLKKRSKSYQQSVDGALLEVVLPDTTTSLSSFSQTSGFSPMGPSASAVYLDNVNEPSHSQTFKYLTIGGDYCFGQHKPEMFDENSISSLSNIKSTCDSIQQIHCTPEWKEESAATITSDSEECHEPLLQTSTQCLPDYIVQQCEEGDETDGDNREVNLKTFMEACDEPSLERDPHRSFFPGKFNGHIDAQPQIRRKIRYKAFNHACRFCPRNYKRLWRMQMGVFRAQKRKLLEEIAVLRLKRRKLKANVTTNK